MGRQPRHRPRREFPGAPRIILEPELEKCIHCEESLAKRLPWHIHKTIQTLDGPLFVAGKSRECANSQCSHQGTVYYASRVWLYSLRFSTYGLHVLANIGWRTSTITGSWSRSSVNSISRAWSSMSAM